MSSVVGGTYTLQRTTPKPVTIGDRVRAVRLSYGMSQVELGRRIGMSKTTMNNLEQGITRNPHVQVLVDIADVLGVTVDLLVGREPVRLE